MKSKSVVCFLFLVIISFFQVKNVWSASAPIIINGSLSDWSSQDLLNAAPWQGAANFKFYGKKIGSVYYLALQTDGRAIDASTTIWIDADGNPSTGGGSGGAEYNINVSADLKPDLYRGTAGQTLVRSTLTHRYNTAKTILEIAFSAGLIGNPVSIDVSASINNAVNLPTDTSAPSFHVAEIDWPQRTNLNHRIAIIYSDTSAQYFYDKKAYSQIYMSLQHHAMMAGLPFDLLHESDLTHLETIINYDALIFPSFAYVPQAIRSSIKDNLFNAAFHYQVGLLTAGDFLTNDESGNPHSGDAYDAMKTIFGLSPLQDSGPVTVSLKKSAEHPIMSKYQLGEEFLSLENAWIKTVEPVAANTYDVIATHTVNQAVSDAVFASKYNGRLVYYGTEQILADSNMTWKAIQWLVYGKEPAVALKMGRLNNLFVARNDMDMSQYINDFDEVYGLFEPLLVRWKNAYGFVGSYYVNIGNDPAQGKTTDWNKSRPLYQRIMAMGNEIGTHSWTHPFEVNLLTPQELEFEFNQSKLEISRQLGIQVLGSAAIPGNPENFTVDQILSGYLGYLSGEYSNADINYRSAIGFMTPDMGMMYLSPNLLFDFTMIEDRHLTAAQAEQTWKNQYADLMKGTSVPIIHWPWHDYGPTISTAEGYNVAMYENLIKAAANDNSEFLTAADLYQRVQSLLLSGFTAKKVSSNALSAHVTGSGLGSFGLDVGKSISSVDGWYAYNGTQLFLPENGGDFIVRLGASPIRLTHITKMPPRSRLLSLTGNGTDLSFNFNGDGKVLMALNVPLGKKLSVSGADRASLSGTNLTLTFNSTGEHNVSVQMVDR